MSALLGKKVGMTGVFDEAGEYVPVTVVELGPNYVTQIKTKASDGYDAVQLGFSEKAEKNVNSPGKGHFAKAGSPMLRYINEIRSFDDAKVAELKPGAVLNASDVFNEGDTIHVVSTSKGRGFQGVVKRHHFGGVGQQTHGQSDRQRAPGSIGASSYPSRVFKGQRMAGRMGGEQITTRNLTILRIIPEQNLILVKGSFAGAKNQLVKVVKG
ncbi:MAG TPA: 50S ribosomal protein L3 [Candidatus Kapabacteria bacterium]|nr:50S ribosomal protein L3 [Candidatus Kapabacteria bacterium]